MTRVEDREEAIIAAMSVVPISALTASDIVEEGSFFFGLGVRDGRGISHDLKRLKQKGRVIQLRYGGRTYWRLSAIEAEKAVDTYEKGWQRR